MSRTTRLIRALILGVGLLAIAVPALAAWSDITGTLASVEQTRGNYDRRNRQYIAKVTITNGSTPVDGAVRLVIATSNKTVKAPDGTTDGADPNPDASYFTLSENGLAAAAVIERTVLFERGRGRLHYTVAVENEPPPVAGPSGTLSGTVFDTAGNPIQDAVISIGDGANTTTSGSTGTFTMDYTEDDVDNSPERGDHLSVSASADGFTAFQTQVSVATDGGDYTVAVGMAAIAATTQVANPALEPVSLPAMDGPDQTGDLDIPANSILDDGGAPVTEPVTVDFTPIDPSDPADVTAFPGADFLAAGSDPSDPTTLESVVLAEVTITGDSGAQYSDLASPATIELRLPDSQQAEANIGDTIPLWFYDEATGLWVEEGEAVIQPCSFDAGIKCAVGEVNHFTWWNVDRPVSQHACFKGTVTQPDGTTPITVPVRAEGVTYNGISAGNRDYADPAVYGVSFKRSNSVSSPEQVRLFLDKDGQKQYLFGQTPVAGQSDTYSFSLSTNVGDADIFNTPNFAGSTVPNPDTGVCQPLHIRADFNLAPVVSLTGPGVPQTPGATVMLNAAVNDADGNYNPVGPPTNPVWNVTGCAATLSNETSTGADLTGSGVPEVCSVSLTASDDAGASGSDTELVRFQSDSFVPGDQLTVSVLNEFGQIPRDPFGSDVGWVFLSDAGGNPIPNLPCNGGTSVTGECPFDNATGFADLGAGYSGGPVNLTIVVNAPIFGGEVVVSRMMTFNGIPTGNLTFVVPTETTLFSIGNANDLAGVSPSAIGFSDFGTILDYVPGGTTPFGTNLIAGRTKSAQGPSAGDNQFDVFFDDGTLQTGDTISLLGFGVDPSQPGTTDLEKIRYGFALDRDPTAIGALGSGSELHIPMDKTVSMFDVTGDFAGFANWALAWRGNVSYHVDQDAGDVDSLSAVADQFGSDKRFFVSTNIVDPGDGAFDSQGFGSGFPAAPGPFATDALDVSVGVANSSVGVNSTSGLTRTEVTLAGAEVGQVDMLRTDFRGFTTDGGTGAVWSVFGAPTAGLNVITPPTLPAPLSGFELSDAASDCEFSSTVHATVTALAIGVQAGSDWYSALQSARLLGDLQPVAPVSPNQHTLLVHDVFGDFQIGDLFWPISMDRVQGVQNGECLSNGGYGGS